MTEEGRQLDNECEEKNAKIRKDIEKLRRAREAHGEGSMYNALQPLVRPKMEDLVDC